MERGDFNIFRAILSVVLLSSRKVDEMFGYIFSEKVVHEH